MKSTSFTPIFYNFSCGCIWLYSNMIASSICTVLLMSFGSIGYAFLPPIQRCSYSKASMKRTELMSLADDLSAPLDNLRTVLLGALRFTAVTSAAFFLSNIILVSNDQNLHSVDFGSMIMPSSVQARNLPVSNGASGANRGTALTLAPILKLKNAIDVAIVELPNIPKCEAIFSKIPLIEKDFKVLFDEHSEGISYKQQFLDQNAFLVYYTRGFDGPGRPSIEDEDSARCVIHNFC